MNPRRTGFTILETILALAILGIALILISQLAVQSLAERQRSNERLAAIEFCNNLLETAHAQPWSKLSGDWAKEQRLPTELADWLMEPTLKVVAETVEPRVKRITVEMRWRHSHGVGARPILLTALFADRSGGPAS